MDSGLYFEARLTCRWQSATGPLLFGDVVARCLLRDAANTVSSRYPVLLPSEAEDAVNARLSEPLRQDPRLEATGRVRLSITQDTEVLARRRAEAAAQQRLAEETETVRLELLRERLLDRQLGVVWWLDRYADLQFADGDPDEKTKSVLAAFRQVTQTLRSDTGAGEGRAGEIAVLRARIDELLATFEDPATSKRAFDLLETVIATILPRDAT
ncbi:hypothetical protein [Streptomyces sp. NPDC048172]|uniref:hypothetical protein n=1 Tax=Streptomyces sp. NPDC048172 TaxID=3365505 RepID=UPI00371F2331